jgi:hypothetical protein
MTDSLQELWKDNWRPTNETTKQCEYVPFSKIFTNYCIINEEKWNNESIEPVQGSLDDCWLISSLSSLSNYIEIIKSIFINIDNLDEMKCGKYRLRLYEIKDDVTLYQNYDKGIIKHEIIVDSYIPCYENDPVYAKLTSHNEVWVILIEKALAKLWDKLYCNDKNNISRLGNYKREGWNSIEYGFPSWALQSITGRPSSYIYLEYLTENSLLDILKNNSEYHMIGCLMSLVEDKDGITGTHAYSILNVQNDKLLLRDPNGYLITESKDIVNLGNGKFLYSSKQVLKHFKILCVCGYPKNK